MQGAPRRFQKLCPTTHNVKNMQEIMEGEGGYQVKNESIEKRAGNAQYV